MDYLASYKRLIEKAKSENRQKNKGVYYEAHHIIPKCIGGEGRTKDLNHPNIVLLTAKEHYISHRLLCLIYPDNKSLRYALWCMINGHGSESRYATTARIYESLRLDHAYTISLNLKGKKKPIFTEEHRKNISKALTGRKVSEEVKLKKKGRSAWNKGKKLTPEQKEAQALKRRSTMALKGPRVITDEMREKWSKAAKGRPSKNKGKKMPVRTDEHRKNLAEASRLSWARKKASKSAAPVAQSEADSAE